MGSAVLLWPHSACCCLTRSFHHLYGQANVMHGAFTPVVYTGHSLGGALATLAAFSFCSGAAAHGFPNLPLACYTFGFVPCTCPCSTSGSVTHASIPARRDQIYMLKFLCAMAAPNDACWTATSKPHLTVLYMLSQLATLADGVCATGKPHCPQSACISCLSEVTRLCGQGPPDGQPPICEGVRGDGAGHFSRDQ